MEARSSIRRDVSRRVNVRIYVRPNRPNLATKETLVPDALDPLKIRRSVKLRERNGSGPTADELDTILTIGSRVPDHGKLTPWRFIVVAAAARRAGLRVEI